MGISAWSSLNENILPQFLDSSDPSKRDYDYTNRPNGNRFRKSVPPQMDKFHVQMPCLYIQADPLPLLLIPTQAGRGSLSQSSHTTGKYITEECLGHGEQKHMICNCQTNLYIFLQHNILSTFKFNLNKVGYIWSPRENNNAMIVSIVLIVETRLGTALCEPILSRR